MSSNEIAQDKAARLLKKHSIAAPLNVQAPRKSLVPTKGSFSTVSHAEEPRPVGHALHGKVENTFQLGPKEKFPVRRVEQLAKDVMESYLAEERYENELCAEMSKSIAEVVRNRVKELRIKRYKVVVSITIGMLNGQGMKVSSRCLWDPNVDTYASWEFKNTSLYAIAMVFGIYQE